MATQTTAIVQPAMAVTATPAERTAYWAQHLRSVMAPLLKETGSYTPSEQAAHLKFMEEHIAPLPGPLPTEPHPAYTTPSSIVNSPYDFSLNFTSTGRPRVRMDFDFLAAPGRPAEDPFGEAKAHVTLRQLAPLLGADTRWMEHFLAKFALSPSETQAALAKIPEEVTIPPAMVGLDFDGPRQSMKAYFPAIRKAFATGRSSSDVALEAFRDLEPLGSEFKPSLDILAAYVADRPDERNIMFVGIDCVDPVENKGARIKCYLHNPSNAFNVVRDVMTLGGRLNDANSLERLKMLRSIWPTLLNKPEGTDTDDDKHENERITGIHYAGLQYTVEMTPGEAVPDIKVYVPVFQFTETSAESERNVINAMTKLNMEYGTTGKYKHLMESVFGKGEPYGQLYMSFTHTKAKGNYVVNYFAKPI